MQIQNIPLGNMYYGYCWNAARNVHTDQINLFIEWTWDPETDIQYNQLIQYNKLIDFLPSSELTYTQRQRKNPSKQPIDKLALLTNWQWGSLCWN